MLLGICSMWNVGPLYTTMMWYVLRCNNPDANALECAIVYGLIHLYLRARGSLLHEVVVWIMALPHVVVDELLHGFMDD